MGHSIKECPFNLKTRTPQQVFLTQEASASGGSGNTSTEGATSGGYRNNRRGLNNNNNSGNTNNGWRSRIQYDANGRPIVQCRTCNLWGHFARECTTENTPKLLCRWCGPGDHEDAKCPKSEVNLITIGTGEEEVLAITRKQAKVYPNPTEEKKRLEEVRADIQKVAQAKKAHLKDTIGTSAQNCAEQNIVRQILQTEVPIRINDLLLTMPQLRTALTNIATTTKQPTEQGREKEGGASAEDQMMLALSSGCHPAVVEMGILGTVLMETIVDGGSGVNVLPEDTWKRLGQPTLWPPTFQLLTANQHGIKPLGVLTTQPVTIETQPFLLDFIVIPLKRKGYDVILGRGWLIQAKAKHDWKKNTLSLESKRRKYVIDLHTQMVGEEALSSDFEEEEDEGRQRMEPDQEGVLRLEGGLTDDDLDSVNGLFHWQMEDYELFHNCNILTIEEGRNTNEFPKEFTKIKEGDAPLDVTPAHTFSKEEHIKYNEATLQTMNLGDKAEPRNILVGDNWDPVLKATAFKIFLKYKDVFAWTYKDLKGVPPKLCVHRIPLIDGAVPVRKQPYRMNKNYTARVTEEINRMLEAGIIFKVQTSE